MEKVIVSWKSEEKGECKRRLEHVSGGEGGCGSPEKEGHVSSIQWWEKIHWNISPRAGIEGRRPATKVRDPMTARNMDHGPGFLLPRVSVRKFRFLLLASRFEPTHSSADDQFKSATWQNEDARPPPSRPYARVLHFPKRVWVHACAWVAIFSLFDLCLPDFPPDTNPNPIFIWNRT